MTNPVVDPVYRAPLIPIGRMTVEALGGIPLAVAIRENGLIHYFHSREVSRIALQLAAVLNINPEITDYLRLCCEFNDILTFPAVVSKIIERLKSGVGIPSWNSKSRRLLLELLEYKLNHYPANLQLSEVAAELNILWNNAQQLDFRYNPRYDQAFVSNAPIIRLFADKGSSGIVYIGDSCEQLNEAFLVWAENTDLTRLYPEFKINLTHDTWWEMATRSIRPVLCVGHFDAHGYSAAGVTYNALRSLGVDTELFLGYCKTGELGRFWKRTFTDLLKSRAYECIILHDLTIDSRHPSRTVAALEQVQNYDCKVIICDHHQDTALYLPLLLEPNIRIYLSDAAGCQLPPYLSSEQRAFAKAGAETDKEWHDPVPALEDFPSKTGSKMDRWVNILSDFIKYPRANSSKIEEALALAAGNLEFDIDYHIAPELLASPQTTSSNLDFIADETPAKPVGIPKLSELKFQFRGRVVVFTERPPSSGRTWYQLMEEAMDTSKLEPGEADPYFLCVKCPYAIAFRLVNPKLFNILLLTHWGEPSAIPVGHFVPDGYTSVGYISACWCDVPVNELQDFMDSVINDINVTYPAIDQ